MKIKIKTELIIREMNKLIKVANPKNSIPYLTGILLKVNNNNIIMTGTDSITSIQSIINQSSDLTINEQGNILVNCDYLLSILRKIEDKYIELYKTDGSILIIKGKSFYSELNCLDINKFPKLNFAITGEKISISANELIKAINQTFFTINLYEKRNILKGINFKKSTDKLLLTTTDSFRLSLKEIKLSSKNNKFVFEKTLPYAFIDLINKIVSDNKSENIDLFFDGGNVLFSLKNVIMKTNVILGQFPDAERIIPDEYESQIIIHTKILQKVIERVSSLSAKGFENNILQLYINKNELLIASNINQIVKSEEKILEYNFEGKNQEISLNGKYLLDAIKSFNDSEKIKINIINNSQPVVIKSINNDGCTQLILPVRTY